jgi:hypothetical protein
MPTPAPDTTRVTLTIKVVVDTLNSRDPLNTMDDLLTCIDRACERAEDNHREIRRAFTVANLTDADVEREDA